jgi:hypothetical protein
MRTEKEEGGGKSTRNPRQSRIYREAIFRTVRGAMMFALNFMHGTVKKSSLVEMMGGARLGRGLGGLDGAAQAGMIRTELLRLRQRRRSIIIARCAIPTTPCACGTNCCRGWRENPEWGEAINDLTLYVLEEGLAGTVSHLRLRRAMVARYFVGKSSLVQKLNLGEIADQCGVHRHTASAYKKAIGEYLELEEQLATYELEGLLREAGIIE